MLDESINVMNTNVFIKICEIPKFPCSVYTTLRILKIQRKLIHRSFKLSNYISDYNIFYEFGAKLQTMI